MLTPQGSSANTSAGGARVPEQDLQQACGGVQGIVETVPAIREEDVAAHLARKGCAGLLELLLDEGVAGLPHQRDASPRRDQLAEPASALHVEHDLGSRLAREQVGGKEHELPVRPDDVARGIDDPETVAVSVEGKTQVRPVLPDRLDQGLQVFGISGIRVVVRKSPVHVTVERDHLVSERPHQPRRHRARDAVAAVDRHL